MPAPIATGSQNSVPTPDGTSTGATYLGRVETVSSDSTGKKFAVVDFALGRMQVAVPEDVNAGDVLRLRYSANGWRVEKQASDPAADPAADPGSETGFTLPGNLPALSRDLSQFENALIGFLAQAQSPAVPDSASVPTTTAAPAQTDLQALPSLIQQVLRQPGGLEFLSGQINQIAPGTLKTLIDTLAHLPAPAGEDAQREFLNLLQGFRRALSAAGNSNDTEASAVPDPGGAGVSGAPAANAVAGRELPRYLGPETASTLFTGRGVVVASLPVEDLAATGRRPAPATETSAPGPAESEKLPSLTRYRLDLGDASLEAVSTEARAPGDFVRFNLQRESGNLVLRFQNPESRWPPVLQAALATADPAQQSALRLAADYLQPDLNQPGFAQAASDLANLISDAGRLQGAQASLPSQDELDFLFRLLLSFPRDAQTPQTQIWSAAARNPAVLTEFLQQVRPDADEALLAPDLPLQSSLPTAYTAVGANSAPDSSLQPPGLFGNHPELRLETLIDALRNASATDDKPESAEKYLLQAVSGSGARIDKAEGGAAQTFYYFDNAWHPAALQWSRVSDPPARKQPLADRPPLQLHIRTQARNLGAVEVHLSLDRRGSRLDFRNEHHDVRDLLARALTPLESLLSDLDLRLAGWSYAPLPPASAPAVASADFPPVSGTVSQLDLFG